MPHIQLCHAHQIARITKTMKCGLWVLGSMQIMSNSHCYYSFIKQCQESVRGNFNCAFLDFVSMLCQNVTNTFAVRINQRQNFTSSLRVIFMILVRACSTACPVLLCCSHHHFMLRGSTRWQLHVSIAVPNSSSCTPGTSLFKMA